MLSILFDVYQETHYSIYVSITTLERSIFERSCFALKRWLPFKFFLAKLAQTKQVTTNLFTKKLIGGEMLQTNLYIRGLKPDATDEYLRDLCQEFGKINSTKAIMDKETQTCKVLLSFLHFPKPLLSLKAAIFLFK